MNPAAKLRDMQFFNSWPKISVNKQHSELQMFTSYFDTINKEDIMKKMKNTRMFGNDGDKNITEAKRIRMLGNTFYKDKEYAKSLNSYNESILLAPRDSEEFALAVANRSAVFFDMEKYKECLDDIDIVLKSEYPKDLLYKIFLRQSKSYLKMNLTFQVAKSLRRAQECVDELKQEKCQIDSINDGIQQLKNQLKDHLGSNVSNNKPDEDILPELSLKDGENPKFLNASKVIDFKYTKKLGRHVVANTAVKKGDVLFIEEPYSFVPVYEMQHKYTICACCLQKIGNCIPCTMCSIYLYCSDNCRQNAWDLGHRWICEGKRRGILMNETHQLTLVVLFHAIRDDFQTVVDDESVYGNRENNYPFLDKLITNKNKACENLLNLCTQYAVWLILYLKNFTDFFDWLYFQPNRPEGSKQELLKLIGGQLVKYILQIIQNRVVIIEKRILFDPENIVDVETLASGCGIYVSSSLLNHSCVPNSVNSYCGTKRVIRATEDIKKGTEVTISYLPPTCDQPDEQERKAELQKFMFTCTCPLCTDPKRAKLANPYLCPRCSGRALTFDNVSAQCVDCNSKFNAFGHIVNQKKIVELQLMLLLGANDQLDRMNELMNKVYHKYSQSFLKFNYTYIRSCYRRGDMKNCVDKARFNIEICEKIHGNTSINYVVEVLTFIYAQAKYCKILKKQKSQHYEEYLNETKEKIKISTGLLEYYFCKHNIQNFIVNITKYLNCNEDDS